MKFFVFLPFFIRNASETQKGAVAPFLSFFAFYGLRIAVILCPLLLLQKLTEEVITPVDGFVA